MTNGLLCLPKWLIVGAARPPPPTPRGHPGRAPGGAPTAVPAGPWAAPVERGHRADRSGQPRPALLCSLLTKLQELGGGGLAANGSSSGPGNTASRRFRQVSCRPGLTRQTAVEPGAARTVCRGEGHPHPAVDLPGPKERVPRPIPLSVEEEERSTVVFGASH